jgi:phospholipase C
MRRRFLSIVAAWIAVCALAALSAAGAAPAQDAPAGLSRVEHILVIYLENRSFDNLFGAFPGADGLANADAAALQVDEAGKPYTVLPPVMDTASRPPRPDPRFPKDLPNRPFDIGRFVPLDEKTPDLVHRFYQEQMQIDGGRMDRFAAVSNAGGLAMGFYDGSHTKLWAYARRFVLLDHFFHAAFGGSFLNHFWLVCACTPVYPNAPAGIVAKLDAEGRMIEDGKVTPDGFAVNTLQPAFLPRKADTAPADILPPQDAPTIGERLDEKGVSWAWYSGGWNDAVALRPDRDFQFHHQPFVYFRRYADGADARARHLKDESDLLAAIESGTLPSVAFYKPIGAENEHPGYADILAGDEKVAEVLERIESSPLWNDIAVVVTYDENGGFWDHVAPPMIDRWGPGTRVPAIVVSPFAKKGAVDHTPYDTTSILKFIELRFALEPLGARDAAADGLEGAFDFGQ